MCQWNVEMISRPLRQANGKTPKLGKPSEGTWKPLADESCHHGKRRKLIKAYNMVFTVVQN